MLKAALVGFVLAAAIAVFLTSGGPIRRLSPEQIESLKGGFVDFLIQQVEKDKGRKVENLQLERLVQKSNDTISISYVLTYTEGEESKDKVTYDLETEALLKMTNADEWVVEDLKHKNQNIVFEEGVVIKADPKEIPKDPNEKPN